MVRAQVDLATATGLPSALALAPSPPSSPRHRAWDILGAWGARWLTPWRPRPLDCAQSLQVVLIGVAVFLIAWLGLALSHATGRIACIWLANGIVSATLLRRPASERAGLLGGALAGNLLAELVGGDGIVSALLFAALNTLEIATLVAVMAPRFAPDDEFDSVVVGRFLIVAIGAPLVPALLAASWVGVTADVALQRGFFLCYGSHALGLLIVTPLLLALGGVPTGVSPRRVTIEAIVVLLLATELSVVLFMQDGRPSLFLLAPVVLFGAFRLRLGLAMLTVAAVAAVATYFTAGGAGPIAAHHLTAVEQVYLLQAFIATMVVLVLPVVALIGERDRLGLAFSHSERLYLGIAEASPAGIAHIDLGGRVTFCNQRWAELTCLIPQRFDDEAWLEPIHPDDRAAARSLWARARSLHQPVSDDIRLIHAGGTVAWVEFSLYPEVAAGRVHGFVARAYDVTQRHQVERALHDSEELYRLLAENSHDVIVRLNLDGRTTFTSSAARRLFGFELDALVGRPLSRLVHPEDVAAFNGLFPAVNGGRGEATAQFRHRCADGRYRWVEASARVVVDPTDGEPNELIVSLRDIDARCRSEIEAAQAAAKVRECNRLLMLAERLAHVGHWRYDAATGSFDCSDQAAVIANLSPAAGVSPAAILALIHPGDRRAMLRMLVMARRGREVAECRARLMHDQEVHHIRLVAQAEHAADGQFVGLFGVMRDVTDDEVIQAEMIRARDEAQEAALAKSNFLATMSHEIRTPMTGVLGMIDLLRSPCSAEDGERYLATLKQSADLLMTVLDDILDFARIESGKIEFETRDFDLEELMQSTLDLFDGAASQKGLLLSLDHDRAGPSVVRGDSVRLQQIVSNLLSNAIKFTSVGQVTLLLSARPAGEDCQRWRIEVRDTGIGISPGKIGSLFEPFVQAEAATSRRFGGTGLGLAISRRLVDAMGGEVGVRSRVNRGSTFWFELSLPDGDLADSDQAATPERLPARPLDLLVAEDNPVNQMLIGAILRRFGHRVTCVENGRQAVDLAALRHFDCILMDMQMPEMDGIAATRAIRSSDGPCAATPIIALTADASAERRRFYDGAGLTDFLTKPIDRKALGERLAALAEPTKPPVANPVVPRDDGPLSEIDLERYNELRDMLGSSRVRDLLDLLALELNRCPARIRELVKQGDVEGARAEAHGLKGAASNLGATALGRVAAAIEAAMNDGHLGPQLEALDNEARRTVKAIAALR